MGQRKLQTYVLAGTLVGLLNTLLREGMLLNAFGIGRLIGAGMGGAFLGAVVFWAANRYWPRKPGI